MTVHVGIDLGTTNSVIATFDGRKTRVWKSPEQNDVTPSAIYIDRRGKRYVGQRAYEAAARRPGNTALLFKRHMGTNTRIRLSGLQLEMTPEECSAEVLKTMFGYLPEEIRNSPDTGTVITVPAAFNQMQKDATRQAAQMAGIGMVALMQEPVAAIMAIMRKLSVEGLFLVYDLGGGTLDVAVAEAYGGRIQLLAHGGRAMCGGRDFDRQLVRHVVLPWLRRNFHLPEELAEDGRYGRLLRLVEWATERAKIGLAAAGESVVSLTEDEVGLEDLDGNEIYVEVPVARDVLNQLIRDRVLDTVRAARETVEQAGVALEDVERIVFVGGPTAYKPLRDMVMEELRLRGDLDVNPMTAVAEGAAVFAESIDWSSKTRERKSVRGELASGIALPVTFSYIRRTPDSTAPVVARVEGDVLGGSTFQVDSLDTGWSSGKVDLKDGARVDLPLARDGENTFQVFVFDSFGGLVSLEEDRIVIHRTAATIEQITASHSIGIEVLDRLGGRPVLEWMVKAGDPLPKKGTLVFRAAEPLKAGTAGSLNFRLWEGEIEDPVTDNRPIGVLKITGWDFAEGVIPTGAELVCDYEVQDSGTIDLKVSVPCIGGTFGGGRNFYSRQEGQVDFRTDGALVREELEEVEDRVEAVAAAVGGDPDLDRVRERISRAREEIRAGGTPEDVQEAMEAALQAKKDLARLRKKYREQVRRMELERFREFYSALVRDLARPTERQAFENLLQTTARTVGEDSRAFEQNMEELNRRAYGVLWRQDWFVVQQFQQLADASRRSTDPQRFQSLVAEGRSCLERQDIRRLREVLAELARLVLPGGGDDLLDPTNIVRG